MNDIPITIPSAKWQACVNTIKCDAIDEHVSIMVKNDWTSHCTWYKQHNELIPGSHRKMRSDKKTRGKMRLCRGPSCSYVTDYRNKLIEQEKEVLSKSAKSRETLQEGNHEIAVSS